MSLSEIEQRRRDVAVAQLRLTQAQTPQAKASCERLLLVAQRNVLAASGHTVAPMPKHLRPRPSVRRSVGLGHQSPVTVPVQVIADAEAPKPQLVLMGPVACVCGESIPLGRRQLGYRTCIDCGSETIKFMIMDVPKSNGIVTANKKNLQGVSGSHKGRG